MQYQPTIPEWFLDRSNKSRPLQPSRLDHEEWKTWLHYNQEKDVVFCFTCIKTVEQNLISKKIAEKAFISVGYKNWSNAATSGRGFCNHNQYETHREAHQSILVISRQFEDIGEQISQPHVEEKPNTRQALLKILSNVCFLAKQLLPLRGEGDEGDSEFTQLYLLHEEDNPILKKSRRGKKT